MREDLKKVIEKLESADKEVQHPIVRTLLKLAQAILIAATNEGGRKDADLQRPKE